MEDIIGHKKVLQYFERVKQAGKMSHAYCFIGPDQLGKHHVAQAIAKELVGSDALETHPDIRLVSQLVDQKTGKTKKNISIDQMRAVRSFLSGKPFLAKKKVVIVDQAHLMTKAAANALLKSLEEPSSYTTFFLVTSRPDFLPQTILSRCQHLFFSPMSISALAHALEDEGVPSPLAKTLSQAAAGRPGQALTFARQPEIFEAFQKEIQRFESLFGQPFYKKRAIVEDLFGNKEDHIGARNRLVASLGIWQLAIHTTLSEKKEWTDDHISIYNAIQQAKQDLGRNIHPRLLVEHILLQIP